MFSFFKILAVSLRADETERMQTVHRPADPVFEMLGFLETNSSKFLFLKFSPDASHVYSY